ncbi:SDR family NAD(P)-dependent oxidoreductase [Wenxinia saemankumensis]|nr:SDR family oxidoreductase [Wenxinia saemankumensis]
MGQLDGQIALVTGASRGIGVALAEAFAGAGAQVVGLSRSEADLKSALSDVAGPDGRRASWVAADLTDWDAVRGAVAGIEERHGRIDLLFANAGRFESLAGLREADPGEWWRDVTVNLLGTMQIVRAVLPGMIDRRSGTIVTMNGGRPRGGSAYAASKAGIVQLTETLAEELRFEKVEGVRVLCANPGLNETDMTRLQRDSGSGHRWIPEVGDMLRDGRVRQPREIAERTLQILTQATPADNGRLYDPDGWV